jgi:hypothetical protein
MIKITTYEQAEAATSAALEFYKTQIQTAAKRVGSARVLSKRLGYLSDRHVGTTLQKGKFAAVRRMAILCRKV